MEFGSSESLMTKPKKDNAATNHDSHMPLPNDYSKIDNFYRETIYPDPVGIFYTANISPKSLRSNSVLVLDTNVLRAPYRMSKETLDGLRAIYTRLAQAGRLFIPEQVAREFAPGRADELVAIYQSLESRKISVKETRPSILETLPEYQQLLNVEEEINRISKDHRKVINKIIQRLQELNWNDEVSQLYSKLFTEDRVIKLTTSRQDIIKEHSYRFVNKIPPGYSDKDNPTEGIGDYLIWLSILQLGRSIKKDVIFVSEETKPDWWHVANGQPLYPRFELVDEYRRASEGCAFHILKLSSLLRLFGAAQGIVEEAKQYKQLTPSTESSSNVQDDISWQAALSLGVKNWLDQEGFEESDGNIDTKSVLFRNRTTGRILRVSSRMIRGLYEFHSLLGEIGTSFDEDSAQGISVILVIAAQSRELAHQAYNRLRDPRRLSAKIVLGTLVGHRFEPIEPFQSLHV